MKTLMIALAGAALTVGCTNAAARCPSDMVATTKAGQFAASTLSDYRALVHYQTQQKINQLRNLMEEGHVVRLPAGKPACIHDSSPLNYRTLITIPGLKGAYWVNLHALDW